MYTYTMLYIDGQVHVHSQLTLNYSFFHKKCGTTWKSILMVVLANELVISVSFDHHVVDCFDKINNSMIVHDA